MIATCCGVSACYACIKDAIAEQLKQTGQVKPRKDGQFENGPKITVQPLDEDAELNAASKSDE